MSIHLNPRTRNWSDPLDAFDRIAARMAGSPFATVQGADAADALPYDLYETGEALVLELAMPGVPADAIDISIEGRQLTVRAELPENGSDERRYWTRRIPRGEIGRTVRLPSGVDADQVQARIKDGLLRLTLPKPHEAKVRRIDIARD